MHQAFLPYVFLGFVRLTIKSKHFEIIFHGNKNRLSIIALFSLAYLVDGQYLWMKFNIKRGLYFKQPGIVLNDLSQKEIKETFKASNDWLHKYSKKYNLGSLKLLGDPTRDGWITS